MTTKIEQYWLDVRANYESLNGKYLHTASRDTPNEQGGTNFAVTPTDRRKWLIAQELACTPERYCPVCRKTARATVGQLLQHCGKLMIANLPESVRKDFDEREKKIEASLRKAEAKATVEGSADKEGSMFKELESKPVDEEEADEIKKTKISAAFVNDDDNPKDSHWIIKEDGEPVMKVTAFHAFFGEAEEGLEEFKSDRYRNDLIKKIEAEGIEEVHSKIFGGTPILFKAGQFNQSAPDFLAKEPQVGEDDMDPGKKPTGEQAGDVLVDDGVGDDLLEDKKDNRKIIEMLADLLTPLIVASSDDMTVEDVSSEIKSLGSSEAALAEFKGKLAEKVSAFKVTEMQTEPEDANLEGGPVPPATQEQLQTSGGPMAQPGVPAMAKLRGRLRKTEEKLSKYQLELAKAEASNRNLLELNEKVEAENRNVKADNKMLLKLRDYQLSWPRAHRLASMQSVIGIFPADEVSNEARKFLDMDTNAFLAKEAEVYNIYAKFQQRSAQGGSNDFVGDRKVLGVLPLAMSDKEDGVLSKGHEENSGLDPSMFTTF